MTPKKEISPPFRTDIITAGELADLLRSDPSMQSHASTIYRLLRRGKLRAFRAGSGWAFNREAIDHLVQREIRQ